jgi:hypothetical protein
MEEAWEYFINVTVDYAISISVIFYYRNRLRLGFRQDAWVR